jgi:hypothetical protein
VHPGDVSEQPMTPTQLLALIWRNGIGRLGYTIPYVAALPYQR